jgi:hypothetical protein
LAKPIVDGIEREFGEAVRVIRISRHTPAGNTLAARLGLSLVPSFVIFDGQGEERLHLNGGFISRKAAIAALELD